MRNFARFSQALVFVLLILLSVMQTLSSHGLAADRQATPPFTRIGLIPLQIQGSTDLDKTIESSLGRDFSAVLRDSQRFLPINDEVVTDLWNTSEGRLRLEREYELDAYCSLSVMQRGPTLVLGARLLGKALENYIVEYENVDVASFQVMSGEERKMVIRDLVYRVINRLPLDVTITSIQGKYVTIAGGKRQSLKEGTQFDVVRSYVDSVHPASQSWLSYSYKKRGTVKVIEVNPNSSVAEIVGQVAEQAIQIGDGARVDDIKSRKAYQPEDQQVAATQTQEAGQVLVPIKGDEHFVKNPVDDTPAKAAVTAPKIAPIAPAPPVAANAKVGTNEPQGKEKSNNEANSTNSPGTATATSAPSPGAAGEEKPAREDSSVVEEHRPVKDDNPVLNELGQHFENMILGLGHQVWNVSGKANAAAKMPVYIVNTVNVGFTKGITEDIKAELLAEYGKGPANKGGFSALVLEGRAFYKKSLPPDLGDLKTAKLGALVRFNSVDVSSNSYGGHDFLQLGGWLGVDGKSRIDELQKDIEFSAHFRFVPMTSGKIGIKGKKKDVQSASDMEMGGEAYVLNPNSRWRYGAQLNYSSSNYELAKGSVAESRFYIGGALKHDF